MPYSAKEDGVLSMWVNILAFIAYLNIQALLALIAVELSNTSAFRESANQRNESFRQWEEVDCD